MKATKRRLLGTARPSPPEDTEATLRSEWLVRRRFSTRSLPSLENLESSLKDLRQTNALYSSGESAQLAESMQRLSSP